MVGLSAGLLREVLLMLPPVSLEWIPFPIPSVILENSNIMQSKSNICVTYGLSNSGMVSSHYERSCLDHPFTHRLPLLKRMLLPSLLASLSVKGSFLQ